MNIFGYPGEALVHQLSDSEPECIVKPTCDVISNPNRSWRDTRP